MSLPEDVFGEEEEQDLTRNPTALKILQDVPEVDPEILEALENADDFEELDDDFIIKANEMDPKMFKTKESQLEGQFDDAEESGKIDLTNLSTKSNTSTKKVSKEEEDDEDAEYEAWLARRAQAKVRNSSRSSSSGTI